MEENDTEQVMPIVRFDWAIRIPEREAQRILVEELSPLVDGLAPGHLLVVRQCDIVEFDLLAFVFVSAALPRGGDDSVDRHIDWNDVGREIWIAVHCAHHACESERGDEPRVAADANNGCLPLAAPTISPVGPFIPSTQPGNGSFHAAVTERRERLEKTGIESFSRRV